MSNPIYIKGKFSSKESKFLEEILSSHYGLATKIADNMGINKGMLGNYKTGAARIRPSLFKEILNNINEELGTNYSQTNLTINGEQCLSEQTRPKQLYSSIVEKKIEYLIDEFLSTSASIKVKFLLEKYPDMFNYEFYSESFTLTELEDVIENYNSLK